MGTHTPGPWAAEGGSVSAHHVASDPRCEYWICENVNGDTRAVAKIGTPAANACLIAAAPDMYAMLERLAEDLEDGHWSNTKAEIRSLIAKATFK